VRGVDPWAFSGRSAEAGGGGRGPPRAGGSGAPATASTFSAMSSVDRLVEIMDRLRQPGGGCPWDLEQDFASIAPYTIEEAYEVAEAVRRGDREELRDELGDLLLQVVFHAQMAQEEGSFDLEAVAGAICDKLVRRHPHVFGEAHVPDAAAQTRAWEEQKARERSERARATGEAPPGALDGVALALPALMRAAKLQRRARRAGFDAGGAGEALARARRALAALAAAPGADNPASPADRERLAEELGELLFAAAGVGRALDLDPEEALREANARFEERFRAWESGSGSGLG